MGDPPRRVQVGVVPHEAPRVQTKAITAALLEAKGALLPNFFEDKPHRAVFVPADHP